MSRYQVSFIPLTPIHIGAGRSYEPFEYAVVGDVIHHFSLDRLMLALPQREQVRLVGAVEHSLSAVRALMTEYADMARQAAQFTAEVSPAAQALLAERTSEANPEVLGAIRTGNQPYVPGSSLKGALRTALLYRVMEQRGIEWHGKNARALEQNAFRHRTPQDDPFRALIVSDGQPLTYRTRVRATAVRSRHGSEWVDGPDMLVETIPGLLSDRVEGASQHMLHVDGTFYRYHDDAFPLSASGLLAACRTFYGRHLAEEEAYTQSLPETAAVYKALAAHAARLPDHACLVRLGWGSGQDAVTVGYALPDAEHPISRRLTGDGFPLGWALLAVFDQAGQPIGVEEKTPELASSGEEQALASRPRRLEDLQEGMVLEGRVANTVQYGAFVDVGVGHNGLIHISELSDGWVARVEDIVRKGDRVRVRVLERDTARRRISLKLLEVLR